ncbi:App1 family protein [Pseudocnuella soli]|uniref:App1 family protein n=1 Tax=Pseudocnuella soli TaxID=2502779 RepID=UPI001958DE9B|nr:phosphatase domain-containing protein [Pseudocnuella soli]
MFTTLWCIICNGTGMQPWKSKLLNIARTIDTSTDNLVLRLRQRLSAGKPAHIVAYRTYGTARKIFVRGRVLEDKNIATATEGDSLFTNLVNMYKRFESNEVPGAQVQIDVQGAEHFVTTDKEGFFVFDIHPEEPVITESLYHAVDLKLVYTPHNFQPFETTAEIMIPPPDAEYGIISDIDDTVIRTGAHNLMAMGKTVLLSNARTRLPYPGVKEFYKALQLGRNGQRNNPFFYVSSSPWNLYDLLVDFLDHNEIPAGPLLLRDFGLQSDSFVSGNYLGHKFKEIAQILDMYPHLNFVLVGDSGEQDPPIYLEVVKRYPGRILAIYIRDVTIPEKHKIAQDVATELRSHGVEMILTEHSVQAAEHAAATGLIFSNALPEIEADKEQDQGELSGKEEGV